MVYESEYYLSYKSQRQLMIISELVLLGRMLYRNYIGASKGGMTSGSETRLIIRILVFGLYLMFETM